MKACFTFQTNETENFRAGNLPIKTKFFQPAKFGSRTTPLKIHQDDQLPGPPKRKPPSTPKRRETKGYSISNSFYKEANSAIKPEMQAVTKSTTTPITRSNRVRKKQPEALKPKITDIAKSSPEVLFNPKIRQVIKTKQQIDETEEVQPLKETTSRSVAKISQKRSSKLREEIYQPPVYRPRPNKAADPYKIEEPVEPFKPGISHLDEYDIPIESLKPAVPFKFSPNAVININNDVNKVHASYKPEVIHPNIHDSYQSSKPRPLHDTYKPIPNKKAYIKPVLLQPVYAPSVQKSKIIHKLQKPLHDPYKPLKDEYFNEEQQHGYSNIPGVAGVDYPIYNQVKLFNRLIDNRTQLIKQFFTNVLITVCFGKLSDVFI